MNHPEELGRAEIPGGGTMVLMRRGAELIILVDGQSLMSSRMHGSEEALATLGCEAVRHTVAPSVVVGGLGMGFTLRATLVVLPADATVVVAELIPAVVEWNRGPLGPLAGNPLDDPRVAVEVGDVAALLAARRAAFDVVLLDVDNGPRGFTQGRNDRLYGDRGLAAIRAALRPGGVLAVWSAWPDRKFEHRLVRAGFSVQTHGVRARLAKGGPRHVVFLGTLPRR